MGIDPRVLAEATKLAMRLPKDVSTKMKKLQSTKYLRHELNILRLNIECEISREQMTNDKRSKIKIDDSPVPNNKIFNL